MNKLSTFETEATNLVQRVINSRQREFADLGLKINLIGPKRILINTPQYESEIEIRFVGEEGIIDVLEFYLYLNGQPVVSLQEIETWLRQNLDDVVGQRKQL